jgi:hypothetical protein
MVSRFVGSFGPCLASTDASGDLGAEFAVGLFPMAIFFHAASSMISSTIASSSLLAG